MLRIILGIIVGFMLWSILWLLTDSAFSLVSPNWYGKNKIAFHQAVDKSEQFNAETSMLFLALISSIVCSIVSGFIAVLISKEVAKTTLILGILLLLAGIFAEAAFWNYLPLWYHLTFLILLIPMTILGGKLRKS